MKIQHRVGFVFSILGLVAGTMMVPGVGSAQESFIENSPGSETGQTLEQLMEDSLQKSSYLRDRIQDEVDRAFKRATLPLNFLLVVLILFPTVAAIGLWLQLEKLKRQANEHQQELESLQADAISEIHAAIANAEVILAHITEKEKHAEQVINDVKHTAALELRNIADETWQARDQIYKKLAEFLPRLSQFELHQNGSQPAIQPPVPMVITPSQLTPADYLRQGDVLFLENRFEEAIATYDQGIQLQPDFPEAWNNRGGALARLQRYEEAIIAYEKALTLRPDFPEAWNNRGGALAKLQRYEEALDSYSRAIYLKSNDPLIWLNMGNILGKLQRFSEALNAYEKALEWRQDDPLIWLNRGNALAKLRNYQEALASYDKAIQLKSEDPEMWYGRGYVLYELQHYEEALVSYDRAVEIKPNKSDSWNNRGNVLEKMQCYQEAVASYDKAIELQPDKYEVWDNRGYTLVKLGRYKEAIASLNRALKLQPNHANAYYNKAFCYAVQGDVKSSLTNLHRAIKLNPAYREIAKTDIDLEKVQNHPVFKRLVAGELQLAG